MKKVLNKDCVFVFIYLSNRITFLLKKKKKKLKVLLEVYNATIY